MFLRKNDTMKTFREKFPNCSQDINFFVEMG